MSQLPTDPASTQAPEISPEDFLTSGRAPRTRTNGVAIVSLITGLVGCAGITAIVAIITGIIGIKRANRPEYAGSGKGMALAGLVLGIVFLLLWALILPAGGLAVFMGFKGTEAPRQLARDFVRDLANNDIDAAFAKVQPGSFLTRERLESISEEMDTTPSENTAASDWGRFKDLAGTNVSIDTTAGISTFDYRGTATFDNVVKGFRMTEVKEGDAWKISSFEFMD